MVESLPLPPHSRFDLVDDDGSGTLEHHELMAALQVGLGGVGRGHGVPHAASLIRDAIES